MGKKLKGFFERAGRQLWLADHITMLLAVFVVAGSLFAYNAQAGSTAVNTNIGGTDMTISRFSEIISAAFNSNVSQGATHKGALANLANTVDHSSATSAPGFTIAKAGKNEFSFGNVGNVLGHVGDNNDTDNAANFWTDGSDASSKMITLETIWALHEEGVGTGGGTGGATDLESYMGSSTIAQYIIWGSALNYMGIDEFRDAKSANDGMRMVIGYATYIFFILAYSAGSIMRTVVDILRKLNVFDALWTLVKNGTSTLLCSLLGVSDLTDVPLMVEVMGIIHVLESLRWVILGLMILLLIATMTVWKSKQYAHAAAVQERWRRIFYRLIVMCIGLPICGMMYTEGINIIGNFVAESNYIVTSYIFQEFMDFEGWTTKITESGNAGTSSSAKSKDGMLLSFRTGSGDDSLGAGNTNPYAKLMVVYESKGNRFTITAKNAKRWGGADVEESAVDVSHFVYAVNEAVYGQTVTGDSSKALYLNSLYGSPEGADGAGNLSYADIVNKSLVSETDAVLDADGNITYNGDKAVTQDTGNANADLAGIDRDKAYQTCRDLLLNYARSTTVKPDSLNSFYTNDIRDLGDQLVIVPEGSANNTAINEAASMNAQVMEQLFGSNASEQRIWQFVELDSPWVYAVDQPAKELTLLDSKLSDAAGNADAKVVVTLGGLAAGSGSNSTNYVKVGNAAGGGNPIMTRTLSNVVPSSTTNGANNMVVAAPNPTGTASDGTEITKGATILHPTGDGEGNITNYVYSYEYSLHKGGMSPLAMYNFLHSKFENGTLTVYSPKLTTNAGVGTMHYAVTTPYSGIPELVQLLFVISVLFSLGIIGWVFGVSLLANSIVQMVKAMPLVFKMMLGSVQGFVEGLLTVLSVLVEMFITLAMYSLSVKIIDFLIRLIRQLAIAILTVFGSSVTGADGTATMQYMDSETYSIVAGLLSTAVILWGTFNLIKWRVAITTSVKSMITTCLNKAFGTNAAMPTGANSGLMKAAAGLAAGGMIAGSLAEQGALDDVVNDLTQSDLGTSLSDKISEGDWDGAMQDIKDYANGDYVSEDADGDIDRGKNADWEAQQKFGTGASGALDENGDMISPFAMQSLTDDQQAELDDKYKDDALDAASRLEQARKNGDEEGAKQAQEDLDEIMQARAKDAAEMRAENGEKARELGVADYGDYLRAQDSDELAAGINPVEGADIPDEPEKELSPDAQMAYDAARDGDSETLRAAAGKFDANGLTEEQREAVNEAIKNGASESQIADMVEGFAEENFGENHGAVVDKMNEAARRTSGALYGSNDNSDSQARTVAVASGRDEDGNRTYGVKDNNSDEGVKTFTTNPEGDLEQQFDTPLPENPGDVPYENQDVYDAAVANDQTALEGFAEEFDENGLTAAQAADIDQMVESGASSAEIAAKIDDYATGNLGANHKAVMERVNSAAGRGNAATYGDHLDSGGRTVQARAKDGSLEGTDWGLTDSAAESGTGESTFQIDNKGEAQELPSAISDAPSKALTSTNQAIFEAARDGDTGMLQQMAGHVNSQGLDNAQQQVISDMVGAGASEAEVAAAIDNFAQDNFGDDYKQVIDSMNKAAGRDGTATYSSSTGGGADGTQPRSMSVASGYQDGQAAYSVDDLSEPGEPAHTVQVSDENGQSIYTDTAPEAGGERIVTSDFGSIDGQTYGSIRSEVDAVANASNGMLQRGSGSGDFGRTTVSEAASEIASRQSQQASGGKAAAKVGSSVIGSGSGDIAAFNKASQAAVENSGFEKGQVAGIAGGVDSHGMATTELPTVGAGSDAQPQVDLWGNEMPVNVGSPDGAASLIASQSVDSYGRSQQMNMDLNGGVGAPAGSTPGGMATVPVTDAMGRPQLDSNGQQVYATVPASSLAASDMNSGIPGGAPVSGTQASYDVPVTTATGEPVLDANGEQMYTTVPASSLSGADMAAGMADIPNGVPAQNGGPQSYTLPLTGSDGKPMRNASGEPMYTTVSAEDLSMIKTGGTDIPNGTPVQTGGSGQVTIPLQDRAGNPILDQAGNQMYTTVPAGGGNPEAAGLNLNGTPAGSGTPTPTAYSGTTPGAAAPAGPTANGEPVTVGSPAATRGATGTPGEIQVMPNGNVDPGSIPMAADYNAGATAENVAAGNVTYGGTTAGSTPASMTGGSASVDVGTPQSAGSNPIEIQGPAEQSGSKSGFTKADIPMALGVVAAAHTFAKTGNLGSAAMAYTGTNAAVSDVIGKVSDNGTAQVLDSKGQPTGQTVVQADNGGWQTVDQSGKPTGNAVVRSVGGGGMIVGRAPDGSIRTIDQNGAMTSQMVAMSATGEYAPITKTKDGRFVVSGSSGNGGQEAVQMTDGSFVTVTKDAGGNLTMSGSDGGATGAVLTRTAAGYQYASQEDKSGVSYTIDQGGQATGSVVVKTAGGENVSVVKGPDGGVYMDNGSGGVSSTRMALSDDGHYMEVGKNGSVSTSSNTTVQTVRLNTGVDVPVVPAPDGSYRQANGDGSASMTIIEKGPDGGWTQGSWLDRGSSGGTNTSSTVNKTTTTIIHEQGDGSAPGGSGTSGYDPSQLLSPIVVKYGDNPSGGPAASPSQTIPGMADLDLQARFSTMPPWQQQYMQFLQQAGGTEPGSDTRQPSGYTPTVTAAPADPDGPTADWADNGGTILGSETRE